MQVLCCHKLLSKTGYQLGNLIAEVRLKHDQVRIKGCFDRLSSYLSFSTLGSWVV